MNHQPKITVSDRGGGWSSCFCGANPGVKEFEAAFAALEGKATGICQNPAERAVKPFGATPFHADLNHHDADDAAGIKRLRQISDAVMPVDLGRYARRFQTEADQIAFWR